mgnify:FL=1|jgi:hypothetical protein
MAKVYAPVKNYTGTSASVGFVNGVGETSDARLLLWFAEHGYTVSKSVLTRLNEAKSESEVKKESE